MKRICILLISAILTLTLTACTAQRDSGKLKIVTTIFPQYDFTSRIAGNRAEVTMLLPFGSESHTYDPSIKDMTAVSNADIFIYTGKQMEMWAATLLENAEGENTRVLDLSTGITLLDGTSDHIHHGEESDHTHDYDPHIWTSPKNAILMANAILEALCEIDPEGREYYTENAESLKKDLADLDKKLTELSENHGGKTVYFGGRFAFLYMFSDYGFGYESAYKGCSEESEPSIKTISELTEKIKNDGAKYIFTEEMSENKVAKSIADETGATLLVLHSCHNLSRDEAMSGENYISLMNKNIANLKLALENK